jgi:hypothetical protein
MTITFVKNGVQRRAPQGFSWTILFFGALVPLFRADIATFFLMLFFGVFTFGLSNIVFAFLYNGMYTRQLYEKGYHVE